jgi:hypothetical protein
MQVVVSVVVLKNGPIKTIDITTRDVVNTDCTQALGNYVQPVMRVDSD